MGEITPIFPKPIAGGIYPDPALFADLADKAVMGLASENSKRVYSSRLREYFKFAGPRLDRDSVQEFVDSMRGAQQSPDSVNQALAAIRKLVDECEIRRLMPPDEAQSIRTVKNSPRRGHHSGQWLTITGLRSLMSLPDRETLAGKRDAALLAMLVGCGLRRKEASTVTWAHYQEREGRMVWVDLRGKGGRVRTVPIPAWADRDIRLWFESLSVVEPIRADSPVLRAIRLNTRVLKEGMSDSGVWWIVQQYAQKLGIKLRPHDLRRTLAQLMRKSGTPLEQIQLTLGHADISTTALYLGSELELEEGKAGVDLIQFEQGSEE